MNEPRCFHADFQGRGICSKSVDFEISEGKVHAIRFKGGCPGCTQGIARLAEGMPCETVCNLLKDIRCVGKDTSCPQELANEIETAMESMR